MRSKTAWVSVDLLDLVILRSMLANGKITFKELGKITKSDHRTIASRFQRLIALGIIRRVTIDVDWSRIGLTAAAYMGSTTALGQEDRRKLLDFMRREPRILEAYTTLGSHEYFMKVVDWDIAALRSEICGPLEPLTVDLVTSLIVDRVKVADYGGLLDYVERGRAHGKNPPKHYVQD